MKIAILGDIHGNIDALRAAYTAALKENAEKIYHLGDLGGYAPFVNEVVDFLIGHGIQGVQGNYDEAVANDREHCGCRYEDPVQAGMAELSFEWTKKNATRRSKEYMRDLPFDISFSSNRMLKKSFHGFFSNDLSEVNSAKSHKSLDFFVSQFGNPSMDCLARCVFPQPANGRAVKIFHATPFKNNLYWHGERDERFFLDMSRRAAADVMIYGHTHIPYRKDIEGKVFINAGSVGKPKDGDPRACIAVVEILPDTVNSDFIRVPYDVDKTAAAIRDSGLPAYFAEKLKEGK